MSAIDQVISDSQLQHQRYLDLYGVSPATGEGFRDLADSAKQLVEQINDARNEVQALQFSTEVVGRYEETTASDHRPVATTAHIAQVAAHTTDTSAQVNRDGLAAILANSNAELNQISAVPDRDSPEGQAAILNIIAEHHAQAAQTVTSSAAAQQTAGAQAAASGGAPDGGAPAGGAAAAAMGALLPAIESALVAAPQAATALIPAAAGLASAPVGALSAVHTPPDSAHHAAPPQQSSPAAPTAQPQGGASSPAPNSSPAPVGPEAPTPHPPSAPHDEDHFADKPRVQLAGFGSSQHPPSSPQPSDPPPGPPDGTITLTPAVVRSVIEDKLRQTPGYIEQLELDAAYPETATEFIDWTNPGPSDSTSD